MTARIKSALLLVGVFVFGTVSGAAAMRAFAAQELHSAMEKPPSEVRIKFKVDAMKRHIDLSDEQAEKLSAILTAADKRRDEATEPCRSGLDALRERTDAEILEILSPEQQEKYREFAERRRKGRKKPGP
ncbi:MAG: hypothetical protein HOV80_27260 [Polyangiaceae bacterium]|nr:hypothetical protein [Polyangiaceae bacterium]